MHHPLSPPTFALNINTCFTLLWWLCLRAPLPFTLFHPSSFWGGKLKSIFYFGKTAKDLKSNKKRKLFLLFCFGFWEEKKQIAEKFFRLGWSFLSEAWVSWQLGWLLFCGWQRSRCSCRDVGASLHRQTQGAWSGSPMKPLRAVRPAILVSNFGTNAW